MKRRAAGFTLIEVAVAMAILGVGVVSCLRLLSSGLHLQERASRRSRVVLHARATMDALMIEPEIRDHEEERVTAEGFRTHILVTHAGPEQGLPERDDLDLQSDMALRYLQVDVSWQDGGGETTYTLKSMRVAYEEE